MRILAIEIRYITLRRDVARAAGRHGGERACRRQLATRRANAPDQLSLVPRIRAARGSSQLIGPGPLVVIPASHARF
jgi:hypothetical protein